MPRPRQLSDKQKTTIQKMRDARAAALALLPAKRADVLQMYLELGVTRSINKVLDAAIAKYGPISHRTLSSWSVHDHWVDKAKQYDQAKESSVIARANDLVDVANMTIPDALDTLAKRYINVLLSVHIRPTTASEAEAMSRVVDRMLKLKEFMLDPTNQVSGGTKSVTNNIQQNNIVATSAKEALELLEGQRRKHAPDVPVEAPLAIESQPAPVLDLAPAQEPERVLVPEPARAEGSAPLTVAEALARKAR